MFVKRCPRCGEAQSYHTKDALIAAQRKNALCRRCAARNTVKKRRSFYGKNNPNYKGVILERKCPNCKSIIKYNSYNSFGCARARNSRCIPCGLKANGLGYYRHNPQATAFFKSINKTLGWKGIHAGNGGEYQILRYFVDYYEPNLNLVIEYDEPHHRYRCEKDEKRQKQIESKLNCKFIRIPSHLDFKEALEKIQCHLTPR